MKKTTDNFQPQGGMHCISNALKQVFTYYQHPLSEAMIFGLAFGISFVYVNQASSPMVSGRSKITEFENNLAMRLQISIKCKSYKDYAKVETITKTMIDHDEPVLVYVDMPYYKKRFKTHAKQCQILQRISLEYKVFSNFQKKFVNGKHLHRRN